jgi:2-oxoisovalerate dehydrogenase E1 component beta subunit
MATMTVAAALNRTLDHALETRPELVVLGEDVGRTGGVFRITDGLQEKYGADRVLDTPVAESGIVGMAFGMAVAGLEPVVEMQFMGFSYPAFDQIVNHVARIRNRSRHRFSAPMVIRIPYGGGIGAAEHHSESLEAVYAHVPGLKVVVPSRPVDSAALLWAALDDPDPVIFLEPIRSYRAVKEDVPDEVPAGELGVATVEREGRDLAIISYGAMMQEVRAAAIVLEGEGVGAEVVDLRSLVPLDLPTVLRSVRRTGRAVVVTEAPRTGGFASEVANLIHEHALYDLLAPVQRVTGFDVVIPLKKAEAHYMPGTRRVLAAARAVLEA